MRSKKGSLVLSLMASGTVAATIAVTHQVAQNFSTGKAQGLNQQQAFLLAQESIALATLMVQKNSVVCSNVQMRTGDSLEQQVRGCRLKPLPREDGTGALDDDGEVNEIANKFYKDLKLDGDPPGDRTSWFETISLDFNKMEGKKALVFNRLERNGQKLENNYHPRFKDAEITWAVRSSNDPSIREALALSKKGVVCRNTKTLTEVEGQCDVSPLGMEHSLYAHEVMSRGVQCKDSNGQNIADTMCDYYDAKDNDDSIIFVSVVVPYKEPGVAADKKIVMNAAVRRPVSITHARPVTETSCAMKCESAYSENYENQQYSRCVGLSDYDNPDDIDTLGFYPEGTDLLRAEIKVNNKGPGILYDMNLKREDIDVDTRRQLGARIVQAREFGNKPLGPGGSRTVSDVIPCYFSSYYEVSVKNISCTCREAAPGSGTSQIGPDGSVCNGTLVCDNVVPSPSEVARANKDAGQPLDCATFSGKLPPLTNSYLTRAQSLCTGLSTNKPSFCTSAAVRAGCTSNTRHLPGSGSTPRRSDMGEW